MIQKVKIAPWSVEVSELVFGVWRLADNKRTIRHSDVLEKIETCIDLGITSFDHADIYGDYSCEELFGNTIKENKSLKSKIQIITKCDIMLASSKRPSNKMNYYDTSKEHIHSSVERSLKNLGVEKIDILLLHRPDPLMNADETADALDSLVKSGKVLSLGVSNFSVSEFQLLNSRLKNQLSTNQIEISLGELKSFHDGTLNECQKNRIRPMAWSPTSGGKIFRSEEEKYIRIKEKLSEIAKKYSVSEEEIVFAWLLTHPSGIIPIIGTNNMTRLKDISNSNKVKLDRQDWFGLWVASTGEEVP